MPPPDRYADDRDDDLPPQSSGSGATVVWIVLAVVGGLGVLIAAPFLLCCGFGFLGAVARGPVGPMPPMAGPVAVGDDEDVYEMQEEAEVGDVVVKVTSAKVGRVAIVDADGGKSLSPREFLQVTVEVDNTNAKKQAPFKPWYNSPDTTCEDDLGNKKAAVELAPGAKVVGRQEQTTKIKSDKPLTDVLVFERPALNMGYVIVTLPESSVGGTGVLKFRINAEDLQK